MSPIASSPVRRRLGVFAIALGLVAAGEPVGSPNRRLGSGEQEPQVVVLDAFEQNGDGGFPSRWRAGESGAEEVYRVEMENGNRFLRARAENRAVHIGQERSFDPREFRRLGWRWRVRELPAGADERLADKHDAAAQVYVVFDNRYWPRVIKFIWSAALPPGSRFTNPLYGRGRVVVLRSGPPAQSGWYEEKVDVYAEYRRFFGEEPGMAQGIGLLTSSDSTKSLAAADYDDFVLLP